MGPKASTLQAGCNRREQRPLVGGDPFHPKDAAGRGRNALAVLDELVGAEAGVRCRRPTSHESAAPQARAYCETLHRDGRRECLDWIIPLTERHLLARIDVSWGESEEANHRRREGTSDQRNHHVRWTLDRMCRFAPELGSVARRVQDFRWKRRNNLSTQAAGASSRRLQYLSKN